MNITETIAETVNVNLQITLAGGVTLFADPAVLQQLATLSGKIDTMSQTFTQDVAELIADVAANTAAVNALVQSLGNTPTPAQLQQLQSAMATLEATTAAAVAAVAPPAGTVAPGP